MDKPMLIVVSGPSGAGKGTLVRRLNDVCDNIKLSVSATTRAPRPREKEGVNYFYVEDTTFSQMVKDDAFYEHATIYNNSYGTPKAYVDTWLKTHDVMLEIEMQGALMVKEKAPDALLIFIVPPSLSELYRRLEGRNSETRAQLRCRTKAARDEIDMAVHYDYVIVNDKVEKAVKQMQDVIHAHRRSVKQNRELLKTLKESTF